MVKIKYLLIVSKYYHNIGIYFLILKLLFPMLKFYLNILNSYIYLIFVLDLIKLIYFISICFNILYFLKIFYIEKIKVVYFHKLIKFMFQFNTYIIH